MLPYYRIVMMKAPNQTAIVLIDDEERCLWVDPDADPDLRARAIQDAVNELQSHRKEHQLFTGLPDQWI
jgi:hypothetical protein